ncbi:DNA mismatch repair protein MutS [Tissierella creatinophila]|uniref:DNA mismatch repair protein MutS n=1 Tax=Tissierella creatinophila DSM 6911 TaxID=1123403 RepID=A0A1U7M9J7_TISCR|nr:DNA mismatch repair protein MutS [Tissierella creatinophila]OLS03965.1 DNA mismatch repair protein MutS [Tissierella creatinophila DSM 6911]
MKELTPMMKQYMEVKEKHPDSILFFRLGDFYEMFFEDALTASRELEITLTQRDCGMNEKAPMCGVPHHVAEVYIGRLVEKGYKVAICEQLEDPSVAKGIVKRDVVRVVTPGTITDTNILDEKTNNFLASIFIDNTGVGLSYVDNSTGEMYTTEFLNRDEEKCYKFIIDELGKISPSEIICNENLFSNNKYIKIIKNNLNPFFNIYKDTNIEYEDLKSLITKLFNKSLDNLTIEKRIYSIISTAKLIDYLNETQKHALNHINNLFFYEAKDYMILDINTRINLEIHETILSRQKKGALIYILDKTNTSMGGRLLKKWLEEPLLSIVEINKRLDMVQYFFENIPILEKLRELLKQVYDLERLSGKISNGSCNGRDLIALKNSLEILPLLKEILVDTGDDNLVRIGEKLDDLNDIFILINKSIKDNPPIAIKEGDLIKAGFDANLDRVREANVKGKEWLANLEAKEKQKTSIKNLKIGYNKVSGYYFEITKSNISQVPDYFIRKQTLKNAERYFTEELKEMEETILNAKDESLKLEYKIFQAIREKIKNEIPRIQTSSKVVSLIDVATSLSKISYENNYTRPKLNNKGYINIKDGRHPVVESLIEGNLFIPNDTYLDKDKDMVHIITGPNMAGKSTYMRQVAIIILMAQIGCFVPAMEANISIVDRIFTRIGAADNLSKGDSTFMVEMNEVSNIIKNATENSLIILDEVGRGTSTYDGLSIAWAVVEHITNNINAKTLFATHYHELTQLQDKFSKIKNLTMSAKENGEEIIFLRKIIKGSTNKSYGIQVARLAGVDKDIIDKANEILNTIEMSHEINITRVLSESKQEKKQLDLMDYKKEYYINEIRNININELTPLESLNILSKLIKEAKTLEEN